jgi:small redox-active disulfide protein 2
MKIEIYGTGCSKCKTLFKNTQKALATLDLKADLIKVEDINQISRAGILFTPALSINGEIKSSGKVLSPEDIVKLLQ